MSGTGGRSNVISPNTVTPRPADLQSTAHSPSKSPNNTSTQSTGAGTAPIEGVAYTTYTIKDGDTGVSIAREWFGDGAKWTLISKANPLVDFNRLKIGQKLRLPPKDAAKETPAPATTKEINTPGKPSEAVHSDPNTYIVKSGDTLTAIARAKYGDGGLWEIIFEANKKTIGDDPAALVVGMKLTIPAKPARATTSR